MKHQNYFPSRMADQIPWLTNYLNKLVAQTSGLGLDAGLITASVADAKWLVFVLSSALSYMRSSSQGFTQYLALMMTGTTTSALGLPAFTWPTPPAGTVAVAPGALKRIFDLVQDIKNATGYGPTIGQELQIVGPEENPADHPVPKFMLKVEDGPMGIEVVVFGIVKYTHQGTLTQSKRGGGAWEDIGITTARTFMDERPLLVANAPEVREYRMRYWDKGIANGPWTDVAKVTVGPA